MIREYDSEDLGRVLDVWYAASKLAHPFLDEDFLSRESERIATHHLPSAQTWVFEQGNVVVGFIALMGNEVGAIFVDPDFHGQGIGRALMDHARSIRDVLELDVFKANSIGRKFYKRYGFRVVGEHVHEETGFAQLRLRLGPNGQ